MAARNIWSERDSIILEAIADHDITHGRVENPKTLNELPAVAHLGLSDEEVGQSVERLYQGGMVEGSQMTRSNGTFSWSRTRPTAEGRRTVGQWPNHDLATALISAFEQQAVEADSDEEKSRWSRAADGLRDIGSGTATAVIAEAMKRSMGF